MGVDGADMRRAVLVGMAGMRRAVLLMRRRWTVGRGKIGEEVCGSVKRILWRWPRQGGGIRRRRRGMKGRWYR